MSRTIHYLPGDARRVVLLLNQTAGSGTNGRRVDELRQRLTAARLQVETHTDLTAFAESVTDSRQDPVRAVVAAGGDGTVSAVVNRLPPNVPVATLPLGTENLLAKYLPFSFAPDELTETILHGATVSVDAGRANQRLFLLMVGCGFDADVVHRLHASRRGHIRHGTYVKPILASIRKYGYPELRVSYAEDSVSSGAGAAASERTCQRTARWAFAVNIPQYAGGLRFAPTAVGTDGWLDLCTFRRGSLWHGLRYLAGIIAGRHRDLEDFSHVRARSVRIEADQPVPYQLDGDPGGMLPVDISVEPARVRLVVSETWAQQHDCTHLVDDRLTTGAAAESARELQNKPEKNREERGHS